MTVGAEGNADALAADMTPLPPLFSKLKWDTGVTGKMWVSNGDIDSGLHFDENNGGFLMQVSGEKHVNLFPPSDKPNLYMRNQQESSIFILRDVDADTIKTKYPLVSQTHPLTATVRAGDLLYIPHTWFHEVYSVGKSISVTRWIHDTYASLN